MTKKKPKSVEEIAVSEMNKLAEFVKAYYSPVEIANLGGGSVVDIIIQSLRKKNEELAIKEAENEDEEYPQRADTIGTAIDAIFAALKRLCDEEKQLVLKAVYSLFDLRPLQSRHRETIQYAHAIKQIATDKEGMKRSLAQKDYYNALAYFVHAYLTTVNSDGPGCFTNDLILEFAKEFKALESSKAEDK